MCFIRFEKCQILQIYVISLMEESRGLISDPETVLIGMSHGSRSGFSCIPDKEIRGFTLDRNSYLAHVISPKKKKFHMNSVGLGCIENSVPRDNCFVSLDKALWCQTVTLGTEFSVRTHVRFL